MRGGTTTRRLLSVLTTKGAIPVIPTVRLAEADRLDRLVTLLDAAWSDQGWFQPHRLVTLEADPADPDTVLLGQRPLPEADHPLDHLLGFTAPPGWLAMGLVCFGWAHSVTALDDGRAGRGAPRQRQRRRARVVTLVDRSGNNQATATLDDGTVGDEPAQGTVSDALHRCLGLPTAPPPAGSAELFAVLWLEALLAAPRGISWADATALHPSSAWLASLGRRSGSDDLATAGRALAETLDWPALRAAAGGQSQQTLVAPDLARWMDDGMFARWVLGGHRPVPVLVEELESTLAPAFFRRVQRTLQEWGICGATSPPPTEG